MTSSEVPAPARQPQVLASGHLHPGMLFLNFLDGIRNMMVPLLIGVIAQEMIFLVIGLGLFVLSMVYSLARYLTFQYRLTAEELVTTEGILHRQERRIPVDRIQDLSFESTLIRRMCGLVVVSVETASGKGAEARLDSLGRARAEQLRQALYGLREGAGTAVQQAAPPTEDLLFRTSPGELMLRGLTDTRLGFVFVALGALFEFSDSLGLGDLVGGAVGGVFQWVTANAWPIVAVLVFSLLFVVLLFSMTMSMLGMLVVFHGFTLTRRKDVVQRRYGLLTTRAATLPLVKIQRVLLEQSFIRRLLGMVVVRADSAGSGMNEREEVKTGRDLVVPLTRNERGEALVPFLLPGLEPWTLAWQRVSPRVVLRIFLKGVLLAALVLAVGVPAIGRWALLALGILPVAWAVGALSYSNLAHARTATHLGMRWGILGRYRSLLPLGKVQAVTLRAGPVERLLGLATLTVFVAGGSPTVMANLTRGDAERIRDQVAQRATALRFVL